MILVRNSLILCKTYKGILRKWTCRSCTRAKSSAEPKSKAYSHTILFPKTNFPTRSSSAVKEEIQKVFYIAKPWNCACFYGIKIHLMYICLVTCY